MYRANNQSSHNRGEVMPTKCDCGTKNGTFEQDGMKWCNDCNGYVD